MVTEIQWDFHNTANNRFSPNNIVERSGGNERGWVRRERKNFVRNVAGNHTCGLKMA